MLFSFDYKSSRSDHLKRKVQKKVKKKITIAIYHKLQNDFVIPG